MAHRGSHSRKQLCTSGWQKTKAGKRTAISPSEEPRYLQNKRILWEHGDLEGSIHSQATKDSVVIGTGGHILYDAIHQLGGKAGRGHKVTIPAREYLGMNQGDEVGDDR